MNRKEIIDMRQEMLSVHLSKKIQKFFYLLLLTAYSQLAFGQVIPNDKNAIIHRKFRVATTVAADGADPTKAVTTIAYFDGLNRGLQTVGYRQSPTQKDVISGAVEYDKYGKVIRTALTAPSNDNTGTYQNDAFGLANSFYGDANAYSAATGFDNSPLNRVRQQYGAGSAWRTASKSIQTFDESAGSDIRYYKVDGNGNIILSGVYPANSLYKKRLIDEQGNTSIEISDKRGRLIQKQQEKEAGNLMTTYYVYDGMGRVVAVIQPEGYELNQTLYYQDFNWKNWVFFYEYDARGRVARKFVPSGGWTNRVYDRRDNLVLEQDAEQAAQNKWSFTKYDAFKRPIIRGELSNSDSRDYLQSQFNGVALSNSYETWTGYSYSSQSFPISYSSTDEKQWFFYDGYNWAASELLFKSALAYDAANYWSNSTGLPTGSWARSPEDPNMLFYTALHYDQKGRVMQTFQTHHKAGTQYWLKPIITNFQYNFAGEVINAKITYQFDNQPTITTLTTNEPDHVGRILKIYHGINGVTPVEILRMTYDEIGRLSQKKIMPNGTYSIGGALDYINRPPSPNANIDDVAKKAVCLLPGTLINGSTVGHYSASINPNAASGTSISGLQTIDYQYHIRGGLRGINLDASQNPVPKSSEGDLFSLKLDYESAGYYDGNIGKQSWQSVSNNNSPLGVRGYTYSYNAASFLKSAQYSGVGSEDFSLPNINYDKNGNITNLQRKGKNGANYELIDNLSYGYVGNRSVAVSDAINGNEDVGDFRDVNNGSGSDYTFWANGSLKSDANKGISLITYDTFLKKVKQVDFSNGNWVKWFYDGSGTLYKRTNSAGDVWEYLPSGLIFKNGSPYSLNIPDGRAVYVAGQWVYEFEYRDVWHNLRVAFKADGNQLVQTQTSTQDAFGLEIKPLSITGISPDNFRYQNQEKIEDFGLNLNWFKFRPSDPQTGGRFWQIDPLAEQFMFNSPYALQENRFGLGTELEGKELKEFVAFMDGVGESVVRNIEAVTTKLPQTIQGMGSLTTLSGQHGAAVGLGMLYENTKQAWNSGDSKVRANIVGNVVGEVVIGVAGSKGASALGKTGEAISLTSKVQETANILKESGQAPATVAGAVLPNGAYAIESSGKVPSVVSGTLNKAAEPLGGVGAKNSGNTVGCCSEFRAANKVLLENPQYSVKDVKVTPAYRPRTGQVVERCENCQKIFGNQ